MLILTNQCFNFEDDNLHKLDRGEWLLCLRLVDSEHRVNTLHTSVEISAHIAGCREGSPIITMGILQHELLTSFSEASIISGVQLHLAEVSHDVLVIRRILKRIEVGLLCLFVILFLSVDDAVNVPAGEVRKVLEQSLFD